MQPDAFCRCSFQIKTACTVCSLSALNLGFFVFFICQIGRMEVEQWILGTLDASLCVGLSVGDMEAVEALMSMMKHSNTQSFRVKHPRPLTPSPDCSEDESAPTVAMQESPLVSA